MGEVGYLGIILFGIILTITGFPISFLEFYLSFILKSYWLAFSFIQTINFSSAIIQYLIVISCCRKCVQKYLEKETFLKVFNLFIEGDKKGSWLNILLLRYLHFPFALKNYGLALFNINFVKYILTLIPTTFLFSMIRILIGNTMRKIDDVYEEN